MSWKCVLTKSGAALLAAAISKSFYITKVTMGSGTIPEGAELESQVALVDEKATATSVKIYNNDSTSTITYEFKNSNLTEEFPLQQVGIWARASENDDDILYMLMQDDSLIPTVIKTAADSPGFTYAATIGIAVGGASAINATMTDAGNAKYDEVFDDNGMFKGTKLKNSAVPFGNSDKLTEIEATDTISTVFGKVKKAVADLISHISNKKNPHEVTAQLVGAAETDHTHTISEVDELQAALEGKASIEHNHTMFDVLDLNGTINDMTTAINGKASLAHNHTAANITSGTLPIARGGTGAATSAAALTNLGAAAVEHTHGAGDISSGVLSADRLPTIPISKGGTGATTAAAALTAIFSGLLHFGTVGDASTSGAYTNVFYTTPVKFSDHQSAFIINPTPSAGGVFIGVRRNNQSSAGINASSWNSGNANASWVARINENGAIHYTSLE